MALWSLAFAVGRRASVPTRVYAIVSRIRVRRSTA